MSAFTTMADGLPGANEVHPFSPIAEEMRAVEERLQAGLSSRSAHIVQAVRYVLASPGKRIRPAILLLSAQLCGYRDGLRHVELATVTEYMHAATLVHDDIVDHADERRGRPAAHVQWGTQTAVLVGDFLYARAIQALVADGDLAVLEAFADATVSLSEGEVLELEMAGNLDLSYEAYLTIITRKTASLIAAASRAGALLACARQECVEALADYGLYLGIGFQLVDDALDCMGQAACLGKPVGQDVREGKVTFPLLHVMQHGSAQTRQRLRHLFTQQPLSDAAVRNILRLVARQHGITATMKQAHDYLAQAKACLTRFPDVPAKQSLLTIADLVGTRAR